MRTSWSPGPRQSRGRGGRGASPHRPGPRAVRVRARRERDARSRARRVVRPRKTRSTTRPVIRTNGSKNVVYVREHKISRRPVCCPTYNTVNAHCEFEHMPFLCPALWVLAVARAQASARASGGPRHHSRASALSPTPRLVTLRRSHGSMSGRQGSPRRRRRAAAGAAFSTSRPRGYACARPAPAPPQGLASRRWRRRATAWSTRPSARSRRRTRLSAGRRAGG